MHESVRGMHSRSSSPPAVSVSLAGLLSSVLLLAAGVGYSGEFWSVTAEDTCAENVLSQEFGLLCFTVLHAALTATVTPPPS